MRKRSCLCRYIFKATVVLGGKRLQRRRQKRECVRVGGWVNEWMYSITLILALHSVSLPLPFSLSFSTVTQYVLGHLVYDIEMFAFHHRCWAYTCTHPNVYEFCKLNIVVAHSITT